MRESPLTTPEALNAPAPGAEKAALEADGTFKIKPEHFLNRDLSWLEFNRRVLHEALDPRTPLLDRVRFLSIVTSNQDEFYMKRVGLLSKRATQTPIHPPFDNTQPLELGQQMRKTILEMIQSQSDCFLKEIMPGLKTNGIDLLQWDELTPAERTAATEYFLRNVFPTLTPLAVDPGHPFPFISNLSTSIGVTLRHPDHEEHLFARVKVPSEVLPPLIQIKSEDHHDRLRFLSLQEMILHNLQGLFPGMHIVRAMPFRVTRSAAVEADESQTEDLMDLIEHELRQRRFAHVVRLEHGPRPDPWMLQFLLRELELGDEDVYEMPAELNFTDLNVIANLPLPQLRYPSWTPVTPYRLRDGEDHHSMFNTIRHSDLLVQHPYESFAASVVKFVGAAAEDPQVVAIKMTLYRIDDHSPVLDMLIKAAEAGKQVVCLVELKARFDEHRNIQTAQALERAGVHVVYGVLGLKTHGKVCLVVRRDLDVLRCYAHIGTGNYNRSTSSLYTDLGLLTCDEEITAELVELFHFLTGRSLKGDYKRLLVAPLAMKKKFLAFIEREVANHGTGKPAGIVAKMNALEDREICAALYHASQAGVPIDLIVRGFCCLRPGVPGLSDDIRVQSVIGRFLEHSRIYHFRNGKENPLDGEFYIGSADWMYRNLEARVEVITPIFARPSKERLWETLQILLFDKRQAWDMQSDGSYVQRTPTDPATQTGTHALLMDLYSRI